MNKQARGEESLLEIW